jgi:hypothetical protein
MTKEEKLAQLHNRHTRYEVVVERRSGIVRERHVDAQVILLGYTMRKSRQGLLEVCRRNGQQVIDVLGITADDHLIPAKKAADGFVIGGSWQVRFTGRTQRDAIIEGEHTFVCDLARALEAA